MNGEIRENWFPAGVTERPCWNTIESMLSISRSRLTPVSSAKRGPVQHLSYGRPHPGLCRIQPRSIDGKIPAPVLSSGSFPGLNYHRSTSLEDVIRKPRDFDGELKALQDKARDLKSRKMLGLGELVIAAGADALNLIKAKLT